MAASLCPRCGVGIPRGSAFCPSCQLLVFDNEQRAKGDPHAPSEVVIGSARISTDGSAARAVDAIPILPKLVDGLIKYWDKPLQRAQFLGDGVRVGPGQLPHLDSIVKTYAAALDLDCPELFIKQDPALNAFTFGTNDDSFIVVQSAVIEMLDDQELKFILAHEMGHIKARHVTYLSVLRMLSQGLFGSIMMIPLGVITAPLDAWSRASEETADRIGVILSDDPRAALRALALLAVGSRKLLAQMDLMSYLEQNRDLNDFYGKWQLYFGGNNHPYLVTRVLNAIKFLTSDDYRYARTALGLPVNACGSSFAALPAPTIDAVVCESDGNRRFCPQCGFESGRGGSPACVACGFTIRSTCDSTLESKR